MFNNNTTDTPYNSTPKPYMGDLTSGQIGNMAKAGTLGGEMVRRMIADQEQKLINEYND